jgi:hypothetical protein
MFVTLSPFRPSVVPTHKYYDGRIPRRPWPSSSSIMPPSKHKKTEYREKIYDRQKTSGIEMAPCTRCEKRGTKCLVAPGYSRCSECIKVGGRVKCDVHGPSTAEWENLEREEKRLTNEWRETQERLLEMQAKLLRLDKQRELFRTRAAEMLRRGLKSIAELDEAEEKERLEEEASTREANPSRESHPTYDLPGNHPSDSSLFLDPLSDPALEQALSDFSPDDPFWHSLGMSGSVDVHTHQPSDPGVASGKPSNSSGVLVGSLVPKCSPNLGILSI